MKEGLLKWLRKYYNKFVNSIAFMPAVLGVGFLILVIVMIELDKMGVGDAINAKVRWLTLKDPDTARTIVATVAAGIISLTVFSFSMVMVVMNQAASQMSNRMLDNIVGDRVQKLVLGFYVGTLVYALFLLTNISEAEKDQYVPSLSVYLLVLFTIIDIFLFVYFLHYITESFRYEQLIQRIHNRTLTAFKAVSVEGTQPDNISVPDKSIEIPAWESGYFQGFAKERLLEMTVNLDIVIYFLYPEGTYILKGTPFMRIKCNREMDGEDLKRIFLDINFYYGQEISTNPFYGFKHLMEVGIKALSPGINDPGTAILSLNALTDLLACYFTHHLPPVITDHKGCPRIVSKLRSFAELFEISVLPIWDYGRNDRSIQFAMMHMLQQLKVADNEKKYTTLFDKLLLEVERERKKTDLFTLKQ